MNNKFLKAAEGGFLATIVMTLVMVAAGVMGAPKMSPPHMLAGAMGMPIVVGWVMHFMIGTSFALVYTFAFARIVRIKNHFLMGAIYGLLIFMFAQVMMAIIGTMMPVPEPEGSMPMIIGAGLIGHMIFAIVVALVVGDSAEQVLRPRRIGLVHRA